MGKTRNPQRSQALERSAELSQLPPWASAVGWPGLCARHEWNGISGSDKGGGVLLSPAWDGPERVVQRHQRAATGFRHCSSRHQQGSGRGSRHTLSGMQIRKAGSCVVRSDSDGLLRPAHLELVAQEAEARAVRRLRVHLAQQLLLREDVASAGGRGRRANEPLPLTATVLKQLSL